METVTLSWSVLIFAFLSLLLLVQANNDDDSE